MSCQTSGLRLIKQMRLCFTSMQGPRALLSMWGGLWALVTYYQQSVNNCNP